MLLNVADRLMRPNETQDGIKVYRSTPSSTWDHLRKQSWVYDQDPFNTNQFQHPYQGATMYGFARSSGRGFWTSLVYSGTRVRGGTDLSAGRHQPARVR